MMDEPTPQVPFYFYLLLAFGVWMLVDAYRRRAALHWYFVILFVPFGALIYFFFVKLRDFRPAEPRQASERPDAGSRMSSPSILPTERDLQRADALEAEERYGEASILYEAQLERDPKDLRALHGLGRCRLGQNRTAEAVELFERLLLLDREYANYSAALDYADALWAAGQRQDTVELLENMANVTGRINHRLALAHYLIESGRKVEARREIERALSEHSAAPAEVQRRGRSWAERAQKMLSELEPTSVDGTT